MNILLGDLPEGQWREVTGRELKELKGGMSHESVSYTHLSNFFFTFHGKNRRKDLRCWRALKKPGGV